MMAQRYLVLLTLLIGPWVWADGYKLLELSGTKVVLDALPEQFSAEFNTGLAQGGAPNEVMAEQVETLLVNVYQRRDPISNIADELDAQLSARHQKHLMRWFSSSLGSRITALEEQSSQPKHIERMTAMTNSLLANEPRVAQARLIEQAISGIEMTLSVAQMSQRSLLTGMLNEMAASEREALLDQMDQSLETNRDELEQFVLASIVYTYQTLTDEELNQYVKALQKPEFRQFYALTTQAMKTELGAIMNEVGTGLALLIRGTQQEIADTKRNEAI